VNLKALPVSVALPTRVPWAAFSDVRKLKRSAAYQIYTATWRGEVVVVKRMLDEEEEPRGGSGKEMEKEIDILSRIQHPNIIKLLGSGFEPNRFCILEYMGGGSLSKVINYTYHDHASYGRDKLSQSLALGYATKVAEALAYMHHGWHPGIRAVHRDLKSDNIAFSAGGEIKLIDFGMVELMRRTVQQDVLLGFTGGVGSWRYMAPEMMLKQPYNQKVDVFSYTMILYHMLMGKHPVPIEMNRSVHREYFIGHDWRPRIHPYWPTRLYQLVVRGWSAEPKVRPNFLDIVRDLNELSAMTYDFDKPLRGGAVYGLLDFVE
jgi:serine/threonine protein kinase